MAWADLRTDGLVINREKVQRNWRGEGLRVARKPHSKRAGTTTCSISKTSAPNVIWAIDFLFDSLRCGTPVKLASMVDGHTRESLLGINDHSITSEEVINHVRKLFAQRGARPVLRCDNGPGFLSQALNEFAHGQLGIHYVAPSQPWRNGIIESFNNCVREEC